MNETRGSRERQPQQVFTRTLMLYPSGDQSFVGEYCRVFGVAYLVLKIGRNVQVGGSDTLIHGAMVLGVPKAGSYKLVDRDRVIFVVVTDSGVEASVDRWPGLEFEHVDTQVCFGYVNIAGTRQMIEVKRGLGKGSVPPYTSMVVARNDAELPGFEPLEEEGSFRELRETLRQDRTKRDQAVSNAVKKKSFDVGVARMHGLRLDDVSKAVRMPRRQVVEETEIEDLSSVKPQRTRQHTAFAKKERKEEWKESKKDWAEMVEAARPIAAPRSAEKGVMCSTQNYLDLMRDMEQSGELARDEYLDVPGRELELDRVVKEVTYDAVEDVPVFEIDRDNMAARLLRLGVR